MEFIKFDICKRKNFFVEWLNSSFGVETYKIFYSMYKAPEVSTGIFLATGILALLTAAVTVLLLSSFFGVAVLALTGFSFALGRRDRDIEIQKATEKVLTKFLEDLKEEEKKVEVAKEEAE
jgi:hypothetical protein